MANENVNVNITFQTNADETTKKVDSLGNSIADTAGKTETATKSTGEYSKALKSNALSVLENGGAMGLLNDLTGGYAMMIKDAVEAAELFTSAKKADTVATGALTTATNVQTTATVAAETATATWTATLLANPIVAITAAIVALGLAVYTVTKYFSSEAAELKKLNTQLDLTTAAAKRYSDSLEYTSTLTQDSNSIEVARAKALGKSSEEIDKLIKKQKDLDRQTAISNENAASDLVLRAVRDRTTAILNSDEEAIKKANENLKVAEDNYKKAIDARSKATTDYIVFDLSIKEKAHNKEVADTKSKNDKITKANEEARSKEKEARDKAIQDRLNKDMESANDALKIVNDIRDKQETPADRENREYQDKKTILEQNNLSTEDLTKLHLENLAKISQDDRDKESAKIAEDNQVNRDLRTTLQETKINQMQEGFDKERAIVDLEESVRISDEERRFQDLTDAQQKDANQIALHEARKTQISDEAKKSRDKIRQAENIDIANNINAAIGAVAALADAFSAGDKASVSQKKKSIKRETAIKVAGIAGDTAVTIMKGYSELGPIGGSISAVITGAIGAASIIKAVKSGKEQMAALGGGDVGGAGGDSAVPAAAAPSVSFVSSNNNQLANTISASQQPQLPIKAYVVSSDVTTAQEMDRKVVESTTI